ncbi:MAG: hypothetical protein NPIRA02_23670 [Nitrospirales bacterium]|nr:MAG: hypothetical protein NPIRA02_23670 [Nitrospirales bacterium]
MERLDQGFVWKLPIVLLVSVVLGLSAHPFAQLVGEQAELERLVRQADDAISSGDPHGATLSSGKAALMAAHLARKDADTALQTVYSGAEALFRTQENGYRALALFEQAGGQPPAPIGACQLLVLASQHRVTAQNIFSTIEVRKPSEATSLLQRYLPHVQEWTEILQELQADFSCS